MDEGDRVEMTSPSSFLLSNLAWAIRAALPAGVVYLAYQVWGVDGLVFCGAWTFWLGVQRLEETLTNCWPTKVVVTMSEPENDDDDPPADELPPALNFDHLRN